jgi:hypothetical protein
MHICIKILKLQIASRACCAYCLLLFGFFTDLFFTTEDVGELFQGNVSWFPTAYMAYPTITAVRTSNPTCLYCFFYCNSPFREHPCGLVVRVLTDSEVRVRFPALPDSMSSRRSGTGSTQPREYNWWLLERESSVFGLENRDYGRRNPLRWPRDTSYPQKLAQTSPTRGSRSRTKTAELLLWLISEVEVT